MDRWSGPRVRLLYTAEGATARHPPVHVHRSPSRAWGGPVSVCSRHGLAPGKAGCYVSVVVNASVAARCSQYAMVASVAGYRCCLVRPRGCNVLPWQGSPGYKNTLPATNRVPLHNTPHRGDAHVEPTRASPTLPAPSKARANPRVACTPNELATCTEPQPQPHPRACAKCSTPAQSVRDAHAREPSTPTYPTAPLSSADATRARRMRAHHARDGLRWAELDRAELGCAERSEAGLS